MVDRVGSEEALGEREAKLWPQLLGFLCKHVAQDPKWDSGSLGPRPISIIGHGAILSAKGDLDSIYFPSVRGI